MAEIHPELIVVVVPGTVGCGWEEKVPKREIAKV
jgi:hypothetical protein